MICIEEPGGVVRQFNLNGSAGPALTTKLDPVRRYISVYGVDFEFAENVGEVRYIGFHYIWRPETGLGVRKKSDQLRESARQDVARLCLWLWGNHLFQLMNGKQIPEVSPNDHSLWRPVMMSGEEAPTSKDRTQAKGQRRKRGVK